MLVAVGSMEGLALTLRGLSSATTREGETEQDGCEDKDYTRDAKRPKPSVDSSAKPSMPTLKRRLRWACEQRDCGNQCHARSNKQSLLIPSGARDEPTLQRGTTKRPCR